MLLPMLRSACATLHGRLVRASVRSRCSIGSQHQVNLTALARFGGATFPKALAQFETWCVQQRADGRPDTPDDVSSSVWLTRSEHGEFTATYYDE